MTSPLFMTWSLVVLISISFCIVVYLILKIQAMGQTEAISQLKKKEREIKDEVATVNITDLINSENSSKSDPQSDAKPKS